MPVIADCLAVYGTLRPSFTNAYATFLRGHSRYVGEGTFTGRLFDLGNYPGAVWQRTNETVHVSIYDISANSQPILTYLDRYEGVGEGFAQPTEYIRSETPVLFGKTLISCWVYLYNWPINNASLIPSGDYLIHTGH